MTIGRDVDELHHSIEGLAAAVHDLSDEQAEEVHDEIAKASERASQLGDRGVLVETQNDFPVAVGPHHSVPYGQINYKPTDRTH